MCCAPENISIIIPVAKNEKSHADLLGDLEACGVADKAEVIISSEASRAKSLNSGAAKATRKYLWFLHADSRITRHNITALCDALPKAHDDVHYFDLLFTEGGAARLNAIGANWRSRILHLPYGDQGFCIAAKHFRAIGGYPENAAYGEDMLFIRAARKKGYRLNRIKSKLATSARKYHERGWLRLTLLRQWQMIMLMREDIK